MAGSLQDSFLAECKRQETPVTVYLVNGFALRGVVRGFDPFTLLLEYERKTHLVYKHAISTISPEMQAGSERADTTPAPESAAAENAGA